MFVLALDSLCCDVGICFPSFILWNFLLFIIFCLIVNWITAFFFVYFQTINDFFTVIALWSCGGRHFAAVISDPGLCLCYRDGPFPQWSHRWDEAESQTETVRRLSWKPGGRGPKVQKKLKLELYLCGVSFGNVKRQRWKQRSET